MSTGSTCESPSKDIPGVKHVTEPSLAELYSTCVASFRTLLLDSSLKKQDATLSETLHEYARLIIWGETTRAFQSTNFRGSLDERVRDQGMIRTVIKSALEQLEMSLKLATFLLSNSQDSIGDEFLVTTTDSDTDSDIDLPPGPPELGSKHVSLQSRKDRPGQTRTDSLARDISDQIKILFEAAALLSRPGIVGKYLRTNKPKQTFEDDLQIYTRFDEEHVREKLAQWYDQWAFQNKNGYIGRIQSSEIDLQALEPLIIRLAAANTQRRRQLRDRSRQPQLSEGVKVDIFTIAGSEHKLSIVSAAKEDRSVREVRTPAVSPSEAVRTTRSKVAQSTAIVSGYRPVLTDDEPRNEHEPYELGKVNPVGMPPVPRAAHSSSIFKCPYCDQNLTSSEMRSKLSWKAHVFQDLRPYVCTFPVCTSGARQYHTRHDWIYHESQIHRRQWMCPVGCTELFTSRHSLSQHILNSHEELYIEHQLPLLLDLSERPVSRETIDQCPLCPTKLPLTDLYPHVARHLEQLSLFILPPQGNETEELGEDSEVSNKAYDDHSRVWNDMSTNSDSVDTRLKTNDRNDDLLSGDVDLAFEEMLDGVNDIVPDSQGWETILSLTQPPMRPVEVHPLLRNFQEKQLRRIEHGSKPIDKADIDTYLAGLTNLDNIFELIHEHMFFTNFQGESMKFLPQSKIDLFSSGDMIMQTISNDQDLHLSQEDRSEFAHKVFNGCRKMFVTCIYSDLPMSLLKQLVDYGLSDSRLPFRENDLPLQVRTSRLFRNTFFVDQRYFNPVFFDSGSFQVLDKEAIIPIKSYESHQLGNRISSPVDKVEIYKDQYSFPQRNFAMRVINLYSPGSFSVKDLGQLEVLIPVTHPGLIATYAGFRRQESVYVIHERADFSLEQYMESMPISPLRDEALVSHLSDLVGAVSTLQEHLVPNVLTGSPRAIDLKDIFVFLDHRQCFRIQKFSYPPAHPRLVIGEMDGDSWIRGEYAKNRPPELREGSQCRFPADIWSLGCIFLEILVWHMNGFEGLIAFRDLREYQSSTDIQDGGFYYLEETGLGVRAQIKEMITERFQHLLSNATEPLRSVVQVVQSMIQIDPEARPTAEEVEKKLANLIQPYDEDLPDPDSHDEIPTQVESSHSLSEPEPCAE